MKRQARIYKTGANASERQTKKTGKKRKYELEFKKQVPINPSDRLKKNSKKRKGCT